MISPLKVGSAITATVALVSPDMLCASVTPHTVHTCPTNPAIVVGKVRSVESTITSNFVILSSAVTLMVDSRLGCISGVKYPQGTQCTVGFSCVQSATPTSANNSVFSNTMPS